MKRCFMYIDDVIWVYRDIARKKPSSIFDNPFMKMLKTAHDKYGIWLKCAGNGTCLNLCKLDEVEAFYAPKLHDEYISIGNHEQYFYPEYLSYQPEYADKVYLAAKLAKDNGFEFIFAEDLVCVEEEKNCI